MFLAKQEKEEKHLQALAQGARLAGDPQLN